MRSKFEFGIFVHSVKGGGNRGDMVVRQIFAPPTTTVEAMAILEEWPRHTALELGNTREHSFLVITENPRVTGAGH